MAATYGVFLEPLKRCKGAPGFLGAPLEKHCSKGNSRLGVHNSVPYRKVNLIGFTSE